MTGDRQGESDDFQAVVTALIPPRTTHFTFRRRGAGVLTWRDVIELWQGDAAFRDCFTAALGEAPYEHFFFETPALTELSVAEPFECVVVDAPQLAHCVAEADTFAAHIGDGRGTDGARTFPNLGGDAWLVAPCENGPLDHYAHLAKFVREANSAQRHSFWKEVGRAVERRLGGEPIWLNTEGTGVHWLHMRLDSAPKYYVHEPYRGLR
jgi:hypothetical protein